MLFAANPNRKFNASLFDEMFDMEVENTLTLKPSGTHWELEIYRLKLPTKQSKYSWKNYNKNNKSI
jgi:hypothetical protein